MTSSYEQSRSDFYEHKRVMHGGSYDTRCPVCRELWEEYKAASQAKGSRHDRS